MSNVENLIAHALEIRPFGAELKVKGVPGEYYCHVIHNGFTSCGHGVTLTEAIREAVSNYEAHLRRSE